MRNFNEAFRKSVSCDNIKVTKNQGYTPSLENTISENSQGVQIDTPPPQSF